MTPGALLDALHRRRVQLDVERDVVRFRAPRGALTPELHAALQAHKPAVVELLRLRAAYAALIPADRERLWEEAGGGDPIAISVVQALAWSLGDAGSGEDATRVPPLGPRLA